MAVFSNLKRKTNTATVEGQEFTLTEPSVNDRTQFLVDLDRLSKSEQTDAQVMFAMDLRAIAICIKPKHFENLTVDEIIDEMKDEITEYEQISDIANKSWQMMGLREVDGEQKKTQNHSEQETSQEG